MTKELWTDTDNYIVERLIPPDPILGTALAANLNGGLPEHDVSPTQGKFLNLLARAVNARRVLEIGTLGGYSTIWLARALSDGGVVVTLEMMESHADIARQNFERAGLSSKVIQHIGPALEILERLVAANEAPFDLIFIDADKRNNVAYLELSLRLSRAGTVIIGDNVIRDGTVMNDKSGDPTIQGVRDFFDAFVANPRLDATALQTVGSKGWDGFVFAVVNPE